jgi:hypothetical protein
VVGSVGDRAPRTQPSLQQLATHPGLEKAEFVPDYLHGAAHGDSNFIGGEPSEIAYFYPH